MPWRRAWQTTPGFLPEKYHGQRSLVGYNFINHKESDTTEHWTHTETAVWGVFIQEKWMNLSNSKQWDLQQFKLTYSHSSIFSSGSLENLSLQSQWKPIQAGNHWRHQNGVCAPSKPHSQRTVIINLYMGWRCHLQGHLSLNWLKHALCEKIFHWGHQLKIFRGNLTSLLPEEMDNNWGKQ